MKSANRQSSRMLWRPQDAEFLLQACGAGRLAPVENDRLGAALQCIVAIAQGQRTKQAMRARHLFECLAQEAFALEETARSRLPSRLRSQRQPQTSVLLAAKCQVSCVQRSGLHEYRHVDPEQYCIRAAVLRGPALPRIKAVKGSGPWKALTAGSFQDLQGAAWAQPCEAT